MIQHTASSNENFSMIRRLCDAVAVRKEDDDSVLRIARSEDELAAAYRLLYREYLKRGFCQPNPSRMHYTFHCFLPTSRTFILEKKGQVAGTLSLMMDSPHGLPAESAFESEIKALKSPVHCIAEIGLFALDPALFRSDRGHLAYFRKLADAFILFKGAFDYARFTCMTDFVIAVHPKHEPLYRSFTFQKIGSERPYAPACGHPSIAMHMNIQRWFDIVPQEHSMKSYFLKEPEESCAAR
ncbi:MAG TPA: hypothetical protein PLO78_06520 [Candidatus Omnitrophota bacterium]|nr:hypothetical protein [Candidatus Omnitrophota bacterium]